MHNRKLLATKRKTTLNLSIVILTAALLIRAVPSVHAAIGLENRYDRISDGRINAIATHAIGFTFTDTTTSVGSLQFEFCSNDPIVGTPCTPPTGFDIGSATLAGQSGETGFTVSPLSTANNMILTRTAAVVTAPVSEYTFDGVTNPSVRGTYYIRVMTYQSNNATGSTIEEGGIAIAADPAFDVSAEVPPFLRFCTGVTITVFDCSTATSYLIDLGEFEPTRTATASSQMVVATNAESGFSITVNGTTLTSGNNTIPALTTPSASAMGSAQFGMNLRANTSPSIGANPVGIGTGNVSADYNITNRFKFTNGEVVVSSPTTSNNHKFTVSYIANVGSGQTPGFYATTMSFIALANF